VRSRGVIIAGAGPTGKQLAALLREENVTVHAFIEVHPRRIGKKIAGIPVWEEARVGEAGALLPVALSAVGQPGRRQTIREFFAGRGYIEGENFFCFA
jgi:FlaA1/EpsC-like NDP-sugar epimerase